YNNSANSIGASAAPQGFIQRPLSPARYFGGQVSAGSNLSLNTLDFDMTQGMRVGRSLLNFGGGLRWANYEQNYNSTITHLPIGQAGGHASRQFNGFGPTLFTEWRRPIG